MAMQIRHILVAINDVRRAPRAELRKAAALARAAGASVELFHAITAPDPGSGFPQTVTAAQQRAALAERERHRLEHFAREASLRGVTVTCTAAWDYPPHEAIVRRALKTGADLVIAATRSHRPGARLLLRNTDWELIRHCPVPLLLVKSHRAYDKPLVLAAVDPFHGHARPADLDARLLRSGKALARLLHGSLHVFHAYMPLVSLAPLPVTAAPLVLLPPGAEAARGREVTRAIGQLAASAGVARSRRHVQMGEVVAELGATARGLRAGIVVMGAVSRSALLRLIVGNTAERVLDRLSCDALVVKPRGFRARIPRRAPLLATGPGAAAT